MRLHQDRRLRRTLPVLGLLALLLALAPGRVAADRAEQPPPGQKQPELRDERGARIPLDATFLDENRREVKIGDYFDGEHPVVLVLVYFRCPMLCGIVQEHLVEVMKDLSWTPGDEFRIVTVDFDHQETPTLARAKKQSLIQEYGRPEAAKGWCFLTGKELQIHRVTDTVGFEFAWQEGKNGQDGQYMHPLVVTICTPDGRVHGYLGNIGWDAADLKKALMDAADGEAGSFIDQTLWTCGHFFKTDNPGLLVMQIFGIVTLLGLGIFLVPHWVRARRRTRAAPDGTPEDPEAS